MLARRCKVEKLRLTFVTPEVTVLCDTVANQAVEVTLCELSEDHATVIDDIASLVDCLAFKHRVVSRNDLLLRLLVALGVTDRVAVLVAIRLLDTCIGQVQDGYLRDVSISIDSLALQLLRVALRHSTDLAALEDDSTVLLHDRTREVLKWLDLALLALLLRKRFTLTNDLTAIVEDLALLVTGTASAILDITLNETSDNSTIVVGDVSGLVALETLERRVICERLVSDQVHPE